MSKWTRVVAVALAIAGTWLLLHGKGTSPGLQAASLREFRFDVESPEILSSQAVETRDPSMFALLLGVDESGGLTLQRLVHLPGEAPPSRDKPDWGRTYVWRLLDQNDAVLAQGRHFDPLALYTPGTDGGCDKSLIGTHDMMLRVPWHPGAETLAVAIESVSSDAENGR